MEAYLERHGQLWLAVLCATAFVLTYRAPVDASFSDPKGTLLTAQAIVERGTIRLDEYVRDARFDYGPLEPAANGNFYDYFPLGTAIAAVPAVALARLRGEDMIYADDNRALQNALSSLTVTLCALLIYALCRLELPRAPSFALTLAFVFGSGTVSTLGTALWSSNLALALGLAILLLLAWSRRPGAAPPSQLALGLLAFFAYLCRPTMALLIPLVALYLWYRQRRIPWTLIATVSAGIALFALFSWREHGAPLPPYYLPSRLGDGRFALALLGHLASPSRGVLVASPFLLLTLAGMAVFSRRLWREPLLWLALGWIVAHWLTVSSFHHWWGGWSFGNRLFVDVLPAFLLLTVLVTRAALRDLAPRRFRFAAALFALTAAFAVFVHTHQGLYNVYTLLWCDGIDRDPSRVFDWRHPQFLASPATLGVHDRSHRLLAMAPHGSGDVILPTSADAVFEGWAIPEGGGEWRWSTGRRPKVLFRVTPALAGARRLLLEVEAGTYGPQTIEVRLNGVAVGTLRSDRHWQPAAYRFELPARAIAGVRRPFPEARIFELEFAIPGAVSVGEGLERRLLGLCLRRLTLHDGRSQSAAPPAAPTFRHRGA